jgi:hypothetical protein
MKTEAKIYKVVGALSENDCMKCEHTCEKYDHDCDCIKPAVGVMYGESGCYYCNGEIRLCREHLMELSESITKFLEEEM